MKKPIQFVFLNDQEPLSDSDFGIANRSLQYVKYLLEMRAE